MFKLFLNSNLISSFQNKNHFNQSIRIIRSMNQKSIDHFSDHVAIFNSNLHENSSFFFSFDKKNDEDFRFSDIEKIVDDKFIDFAIESEFENNDYVEFDLNMNFSTNFDLKKIILKSNMIKQLKKKFMKFNQFEQKKFDQNFINAKFFLFFDSHKFYIIQNFQKSKIFDKIFRLLLIKKFEKENFMTKISSHIRYDKLFKNVIDVIKTKFSVEQIQIQNAFVILFHSITQIFVNFKSFNKYINFLYLFKKAVKHLIFITSNFLITFRKKFRVTISIRKKILFSSSKFFNKKIRIAKNASSAKSDVENYNVNDLFSIKSKRNSFQKIVKNEISDSINFDRDIIQKIAKIVLKIVQIKKTAFLKKKIEFKMNMNSV